MIRCPSCHQSKIKKNGMTHYGKQNHRCKSYGRQFVLNNQHTIPEEVKHRIELALQERISLRGICRIFNVSLTWLLGFAIQTWSNAPHDLGIDAKLLSMKDETDLQLLGLQIDEGSTFVSRKTNKVWLWIVYEPTHQQVLAFHLGSRGIDTLKALWRKIPRRWRTHGFFETDYWEAYLASLKLRDGEQSSPSIPAALDW